MKRTWNITPTACCVMLILLACSATIRQKEEHYSNKQVREQWTEARDTTGTYVRHGKYYSWHKGGQQHMVGEYSYGARVGLWTSKDESGRLTEWQEYSDGELHGLSVSYYPNREKEHEGKYVHDRREGLWRSWHENGIIREEGSYLDGKEEGRWITWFPTGQKRQELNFKGGILDGNYTIWRENGLRWVEGRYNDGDKLGVWTTWDELGLVISREEYETESHFTESEK